VIVACDATYDPDLTFDGLGTLITICETELGAKIVIDINAMRPGGDSRWGDHRSAVGDIFYADDTQGAFIYLKAAMTGREDSALLQYHARNPAFPHETTGDRFERERQFESYRRLGADVTYHAFASAVGDRGAGADWDFVSLATRMLGRRNRQPRIFICYRRDESAGHAGRLREHLGSHFGPANVFLAPESIQPGENYVQVLQRTLGSCEALVAVIGTRWLTAADRDGQPRLFQAEDWVRLEIVAALARNVAVFPLLVGDARMPEARDLPADLAPLAERHAWAVSDAAFSQGVRRLIEALEVTFEALPS